MKKLFVIFALLFTSAICLTACNSGPSVQGNFNENSYVVSLGQTLDFYDEFKISNGASLEDITFVSSNESIIEKQEDGTFVASKSGRAIIFAQYHSETFAQADIIVKYKFSTPTKPSVDDEGTMTWQPSFAQTDEGTVYATSYTLEYANITDLESIDTTEIEFEREEVEDSFVLPEVGSYYVRLTANGQEEEYVDKSSTSDLFTINYGVMGRVENATIETSQTSYNETATLSWQEKDNAIYDVYLNGLKIFENLEEASFTYNFSLVENGQQIEINIVAKDKDSKLLDTSTVLSVAKLDAPSVGYQSSGISYIYLTEVDNATSYLMYIDDLVLGNQFYQSYEENFNQIFFEDLNSGIYRINALAVGGSQEDTLFLNSKPCEDILVAKLERPSVNITFEDDKAIFNFEEQYYNNRYLIIWADQSRVVSGDSCEIDLSDLEAGNYVFTVRAIPDVQDGEVVPFEMAGESTQTIIASEVFNFDFTILGDFTDVSHRFEGEVSEFGFNEVEYANYYQIYINDSPIDNAQIDIVSGYVYIRVDSLKNIEPIDGKYYNITIYAGLENEGVELAPVVSYSKTLTILDIVSEGQSQTNGYYSWQGIDNEYAYYEYQIFSADENYQINSEEPVDSGGTSEDITLNALGFGYYVIRIYTISTSENEYLNANYYDENRYFEANFLVYEQIETPNVTFSAEDGYRLQIQSSLYNGSYKILVNGEIDGEMVGGTSQESVTYTYLLDNKFENVGTYTLQVVALPGNLYDNNLHTESEPYTLTVTRLDLPQFEMREVVSGQDVKLGEEIAVAMASHAKEVVVTLTSQDNQIVNSDKSNIIDISDQSVYSSNFILSFYFVAEENDGDDYYIDSFTREVTFNRVKAPTNLAFSDEILSWDANNDQTEGYYVTVILTNSTNGNYYYRYYTEENSLNLQDLINDRCEQDSFFATSYRQAENVTIEVYAYANSLQNEVFYLPSALGRTASGQTSLVLNTLEEPVLSFNPTDLILSWTQVASGTVYDIYVDGRLVKEDYTNVSINLSDLGEIDYLTSKSIYVVAKNSGYLNSAQSNTIYVKQLSQIDSLTIAQSEGQYIATFTLNSDLVNIKEVQVNGSSEDVTFESTQNSGTFNPLDYDSDNFTLQVIAQNSSSTYYYIDSLLTTFSLTDLSDVEFNASLSEDQLKWDTIVNDFQGNSLDPIVYILTITSGEQSHTITTTETSYNLQEIEEEIGVILNGEVKITITAKVDKDYTLNLTDGQARGYYGSKDSEEIVTEKLNAIESFSYQIIDDMSQSNLMAQKQNAYVTVTWQDLWADTGEVYFNAIITSEDESEVELNLTNGSNHENYSLSSDGENYTLTLRNPLLKQGRTTITIIVVCQDKITSQSNSFEIDRLSQVESATVSQDGLLTIDDANSAFVMQLSIAERVVEREYTFSGSAKTIDLMIEGLLQDVYGYYTIALLSFDQNNAVMPSSTPYLITGTKLQGIETSEIDNYGFINLTLYADDFENLVFTARTAITGGSITINVSPVTTDSPNLYRLYIPSIIAQIGNITPFEEGRHTFEITVSQDGYVRSDYHSFTFDYTIEETLPTLLRQNYAQDYLVLDALEDDDTVGITMLVINYDLTGGVSSGTYYLNDASLLKGYWCVDDNTGERYFTKTMDSALSGVTYNECYAVDLNELLADYDFGQFGLEIVRIGRGEVVNIYNAHATTVLKLNRVEDDDAGTDYVRIVGNNLTWQWNANELFSGVSGYTASAYYVNFRSAEGDESFRILSFSSALDLRTVDLTPGKVYYITVTAISSYSNVLASSESQNQVQTLKFTQPLPIEVVDGVIVFDEDAFMSTQFMQDITNYFASTEHEDALFNILSRTSYSSPFYFNMSDLVSQSMTLRFTQLDSSGAETSNYYTMTVPGYLLFPDVVIENNNLDILASRNASYFELLEAYANTLEDATASNAINFIEMVDTINYADYYGLSSIAILFDDFGREIPAGNYAVSLIHAGGSGRYISSEPSQATTIYLTGAPSVTLNSETVGNETYYTATFGNSMTYVATSFDGSQATNYSYQYVTNYRMILRSNYNGTGGVTYDSGICFNIVYHEGSGWLIDFGGQYLDGVITSLGDTAQAGFKVNMTLLREQYDALGGDTIDINTLIRVDVVSASSDNGYVPNGKSAIFYVRYLDLPTDSVTFENGRMTITTNLTSTNSILMRYRARGSEIESTVIQINNGIANIDLPREGEYQYIILSLNGSISYNTMNVESKTYEIENVYKLSSPVLTTQNNNLHVSYNLDDFNYTQDQSLHFMLANDVSLRNGEGYYYSSTITRDGRNYITYTVGALDSLGQMIYPSELNASAFYAYLLGNSGTIVASQGSSSSHGADYVWTFMAMNSEGVTVPSIMLFSSVIPSQTSTSSSLVNARMLDILDEAPYVEQGNIIWKPSASLPIIENGDLLYQVDVLYYNMVVGESAYDTTYDYVTQDTYYTTNSSLSAEYISQDYDYYTIEVTPIAGTFADEDPRCITTIENEKYLIVDSVYYSGQNLQVLRGCKQTLGSADQPLTRTSMPILAPNDNVNNNGVNNGSIVYFITTANYGNDQSITDINSQDTTSRTIIQAIYTQGGQTITKTLTGSFTYSLGTSSDTTGYVRVVFTPDEGQLQGISQLSISVQMYNGNGLLSKALIIDNVYKLSDFNDSYFEIVLVGDQTVLDFTNYFRYVTIAGSSSNYQIVIDYTTTTSTSQMIMTQESVSKMFTITNNMLSVNVQARDNQGTSATNRLKILYSDTLRFEVKNTVAVEDGQNLIAITWDTDLFRFVWNWTNGASVSDYEYYINIETDTDRHESQTVNNYYMPRQSGNITSFSVRARHISQERYDGVIELYLFSQAIYYSQGGINFDLFSGGDGSQENPYRISSEEDFYNIAKRNNQDEQFYFVLTRDLVIDNDMLISSGLHTMGTFYGILDGNNYSLTITADRLYEMDTYRDSITGLNSIDFTSYFSLFEQIDRTAHISDLEINFVVDTSALSGSNVILSPLALRNYGSLDNITISSIQVTRLRGTGTINNVFMGGIVGINYGSISNSNNNADLSYNMQSQLNINFGYGAIAVFNTSSSGNRGSIVNSFNNGDVNINVRQQSVNVYISGVVINNYSQLSMVGNNGNFTQTSSVSCAVYFTGVALYSYGGEISYAFNNGSFEASQMASNNNAGIVYTLYSGQINYLADTKGYAIARICQSSPVDYGENYCFVNSGTDSSLSTVELSAVNIEIGDGRYFVITYDNGQYTASIQ